MHEGYRMNASGGGHEPHTGDVLTKQRGNVLLITINRPQARNSVNRVVAESIGEALDTAETDPAVRAIVLTGAGDRAFCAGADLKALAAGKTFILRATALAGVSPGMSITPSVSRPSQRSTDSLSAAEQN